MRIPAFLLSVFLLSTPVFAAPASPVTKSELNGLIRDYLLEHPEVIVDALEVMQQREQQKAQAKAADAVQANKRVVYEDKTTPSIGPADAPVTIVEFSDYNCGACKSMFVGLERLMTEQKGKVRLLIKEFPIFGPVSQELSHIALAVYELAPDKYFEFHTAMMKYPGRMQKDAMAQLLTRLGLDAAKVYERAQQPDMEEAVQRNHALGNEMGIQGTPTLIIGDEVVPQALGYEELVLKVEQQARKKK